MTAPEGEGEARPDGSGGADQAAPSSADVWQGAALALVAALRAGLDAVEVVIRDPGPVIDAALAAGRAAVATTPTAPPPPSPADHHGGRVQRIRVVDADAVDADADADAAGADGGAGDE